MKLHQTINEQIKDAMRAKDAIKLETLRGLSAAFKNEMIANPGSIEKSGEQEYLADDKALALVKRSVKQRKDSIEQFEKGGRADLAEKEKVELGILETFMPKMMSKDEIRPIATKHVEAAKVDGKIDPKAMGKVLGGLMKELAGKADGADVKAVVDELLK